MKAVINCDDFIFNFGFSRGILKSYQKGIVTSTSIRVNTAAYANSKQLLKKELKNIGKGIHVDLTHGPFITQKLIKSSGRYGFSFLEYLFKFALPSKKLIRLVKNEVEAQIIKAEKDGIKIDHINGHDHIHMIPSIFRIFCEVAQKHDIKWIRMVNEPLYFVDDIKLNAKIFFYGNFLKHFLLNIFSIVNKPIANKFGLKTADAFYGLTYSNNLNEEVIIKSLTNALHRGYGVVEMTSHPAQPSNPLDQKTNQDKFTAWFSNLKERRVEMQALTDPAVINFIKKNKIKLVSYNKLI